MKNVFSVIFWKATKFSFTPIAWTLSHGAIMSVRLFRRHVVGVLSASLCSSILSFDYLILQYRLHTRAGQYLNDIACAAESGAHFVALIMRNAGTSDTEVDGDVGVLAGEQLMAAKSRSMHFQEAFYRGVGYVYANNRTFDEGNVTAKVKELCQCVKWWYVLIPVVIYMIYDYFYVTNPGFFG
jgi:hypothetical protein